MSKQRPLDLGGDGLFALWRQLPEPSRQEAIALWARVIAKAAQSEKQTKDTGDDEK